MIHLSRPTVTLALACALCACVDPAGRFDDFKERVYDAEVVESIDASELDEIPDVTGTFLFSLAPYLDPDQPFQFIADVTLTAGDDGAALDLSVQPLHVEGRAPPEDDLTPVGDPLAATGVEVQTTGEFEAVFAALPDPEDPEDCMPPPDAPAILPGEANGLSGSRLEVAVSMRGEIRSENLFCGEAVGYVLNLGCLDLSTSPGSTFAAIRVDDGTIGTDLPDPVTACPDPVDEPDAGIPDAGTADAGTADAGAVDDAAPGGDGGS